MKIAIYCTNTIPYPVPTGQIYANMAIAGEEADALVKLGHDVTFFAPEGTKTQAKLETLGMQPFSDPTISLKYPHIGSSYEYENLMMVNVLNYAQDNDFDIVQLHSRPFSAVNFAALKPALPIVITAHDALTDSAYNILPLFNQFKNLHFVSISKSQQTTCPSLRWEKVIYHGLTLSEFPFTAVPEDYLLYSGRIMPEKGTDIAVQVALKTGQSLKICGSIYKEHQPFFDEKIAPFLNDKIQYLGVLGKDEVVKLNAKAKGLLMPIRWSEAFGLVVIEAMACGTPVIAMKKASMPEIITDGKTGFLVSSEEEMITAVSKLATLDRKDCRLEVETRFTLEEMAKNYVSFYQSLLS